MLGTIAVALAPSILLIALGNFLRKRGVLTEAFWSQAERLTYFILLPALLVQTLASAPLKTLPVAGMGGALILSILIASAGLFLAHRHVAHSGPAFTSVLQGSIRFNNYVALSVIPMLEGAAGLGLAAVASAVIVPTVNIICVIVLNRFGRAQHSGVVDVLRTLARNPLLLACVLGAGLNLSGIGLHGIFDSSLKSLSAASVPLGLLCVGAALRLEGTMSRRLPLVAALGMRFGIMPLLTIGVCFLLGLEGAPARVAVLIQALPTATSSYILARQLGGDAPLMAMITTLEHLLAAVTLVPTIFLATLLFP